MDNRGTKKILEHMLYKIRELNVLRQKINLQNYGKIS